MSDDVFAINRLGPGAAGCVVEIRQTAPGDPYVGMAEKMGLRLGLRLVAAGHTDSFGNYLFTAEQKNFGLSAELCERVYVRQCS